jgi:hypothetical protein
VNGLDVQPDGDLLPGLVPAHIALVLIDFLVLVPDVIVQVAASRVALTANVAHEGQVLEILVVAQMLVQSNDRFEFSRALLARQTDVTVKILKIKKNKLFFNEFFFSNF